MFQFQLQTITVLDDLKVHMLKRNYQPTGWSSPRGVVVSPSWCGLSAVWCSMLGFHSAWRWSGSLRNIPQYSLSVLSFLHMHTINNKRDALAKSQTPSFILILVILSFLVQAKVKVIVLILFLVSIIRICCFTVGHFIQSGFHFQR